MHQNEQYDPQHIGAHRFVVGNELWVPTGENPVGQERKLHANYEGPYKVSEQLGEYTLE